RRHSLHHMFRTPEIAVEVTLQPVRGFAVDAAIIFSDILLPLQGMGLDLEYTDARGPVIHNPVRSHGQVESLRVLRPEEHMGYALESIRLVRAELNGRVPLIGFAGAPFTLASYMIEGGTSRNHHLTKTMMYARPDTWSMLMEKLTESISGHLHAQVDAGAQVLQIFDSWVGCLNPADYRDFVLPYARRMFQSLAGLDVPSIHFGTGSSGLLPLLRDAGGDVIGCDWRISLRDAWERVGRGVALQGNLDPAIMLAPWPLVEARAKEILDQADGRPGHIFNLGHGVLPDTPVDSVRRLVDFVHAYRPARPASRV
ncbi:MAG: uroporphyrinogen decarboxylase, partial [Acidobacteria bacterium]|nr:uroporphyrinogen decarboxylase [Acidobacteriota bacterium]